MAVAGGGVAEKQGEHGSIVDIGSLFEAVKRAPFPEKGAANETGGLQRKPVL
jgi:hypothetical protein